jgi:hypothetical protein
VRPSRPAAEQQATCHMMCNIAGMNGCFYDEACEVVQLWQLCQACIGEAIQPCSRATGEVRHRRNDWLLL